MQIPKRPSPTRRAVFPISLTFILALALTLALTLTLAAPRSAAGQPAASPSRSAQSQSHAVVSASHHSSIVNPKSEIQNPKSPYTYTLYFPAVANVNPPLSVAGIETQPLSDSGGLAKLQQAGAVWVRYAGIWWPDVEATQGVRDWTRLSGAATGFANATSRGYTTIAVVRGTPAWAQKVPTYACGPIAQDKFSAFADFMAALVARYSVPPYNVHYWELVNEPDIDPGLVPADSLWGCWGNWTDPSDPNYDPYYGGGYYGEMLKVVYPRIKAADPSAQVLVGGLLLDCDPRPATYSCQAATRGATPSMFLEGILRDGAGPYFDGIAYHAYDYYTGALGGYVGNFHSTSATTGPVSAAKAGFLRGVLNQYGVTGKYLLNTESGLLCSSCDGEPNYEMTKAYYVAHLYSQSVAIDLRANIWYSVFGWAYRSDALLNTNLSARPAYTAFKTVTALLGGASYAGPVTSADVGGSAQVLGYKFTRGTQRIWIVWSADAAAYSLVLPTPPQRVYDVFGASVTPADPTTVPLYPSGRLLVYLVWSP